MGCSKGGLIGLFFYVMIWGEKICAGDISIPSAVEAESILNELSRIERALRCRAQVVGQMPLPIPGSNNFARLKAYCAGLLSDYLDLDPAGPDADFSAYLDAHSGALPVLDPIGVTLKLGLPTNYFAYAPPVWGPVQDRTNGWTAAGGVHLPAGKSQWTAADYGPEGLRRIIEQMRWTRAWPYWNGARGELNVRWTGSESIGGWSDCVRYCEESWPVYHRNNNLRPQSGTAGYRFYEDDYYVRYVKIWNELEVDGLATQFAHAVDFYVKCGLVEDPYLPVTGVFDPQGVSGIREGYSRIERAAASCREQLSVRLGDDGNTPMNWCDEPDDTAMSFRGWEAHEEIAVVRWIFSDEPGQPVP